jgi:beta-glucanase (GH16 family)
MVKYFICRAALVGALLIASPAFAWTAPATIDPTQFPLTFEDEFNTLDAGPDQSTAIHRWRTIKKACLPSAPLDCRAAGAQGVYADDAFLTSSGAVTIRTEKRPMLGRDYTSGWLATRFSFSQLHGYFEVSAKLPVGKGLWPAFWLVPISGQWPNGGEIDIFEGLGDRSVIYCSKHSGVESAKTVKITLPFDVSAGYHQYGAAWTASELVYYVDRKEVARLPTPADMTVPMYIILNTAVGGSWPGLVDSTTPLPAGYSIERVSVWQLP